MELGVVAFVVPRIENDPPELTVIVPVPLEVRNPLFDAVEVIVVGPLISTPPMPETRSPPLFPEKMMLFDPPRVILLAAVSVILLVTVPLIFPFRESGPFAAVMVEPPPLRVIGFDKIAEEPADKVAPESVTVPVPKALLPPTATVPAEIVVGPL